MPSILDYTFLHAKLGMSTNGYRYLIIITTCNACNYVALPLINKYYGLINPLILSTSILFVAELVVEV